MPKIAVPLALTLLAAAAPVATGRAWAWGATGHRLIGQAAVAAFPVEVPDFLRTPRALQEIGELAREPDRSKGSGQPHDADLDPGHFVDVDDQGRINGGPALADLPPTREAYQAALEAAHTDEFKSGYLPYSIIDGYEQLVTDFRYWRVETAGLKSAADANDRAWLARDRTLREVLILRDLGYWAHFVGDGSQPMHVSVHYNGWGDGPNPQGYTQDKIHAPFEGSFVRAHVTLAATEAAMHPYVPCRPIVACTSRYLAATNAQVEPLYRLWRTGAFQAAAPTAVDFTTAQVAAAADALRDLVVDAWRESDEGSVGYPKFSVKDAEAGQPVPMGALQGED